MANIQKKEETSNIVTFDPNWCLYAILPAELPAVTTSPTTGKLI